MMNVLFYELSLTADPKSPNCSINIK